MDKPVESLIRLRMSMQDAHYGGNLVDGAKILHLVGDAVTELLVIHDGDEGLTRVMTSENLAPVHGGDFVEVRARLTEIGRTSRKFECTAHKVASLLRADDSAADVLAEPVLVLKATGVAVVPLDKQRRLRAK
jgi:3-aminobutyryl-CoA ammonia-lyase